MATWAHRRTYLTPERFDMAVTLARRGNKPSTIAAIIGVGHDIFHRWIDVGTNPDDERWKELRLPKIQIQLCADFADAIKKAIAEREAESVATMQELGKHGSDSNRTVVTRKVRQPVRKRDGSPLIQINEAGKYEVVYEEVEETSTTLHKAEFAATAFWLERTDPERFARRTYKYDDTAQQQKDELEKLAEAASKIAEAMTTGDDILNDDAVEGDNDAPIEGGADTPEGGVD